MKRKILNTALAMVVIMTFYFMAGAAVVTNNLQGTEAKLVQGGFIWLSVIAAILFYFIRSHSISGIGFRRVEKGTMKELYYCIPMIIVALSGMIAGVDFSQGMSFLLASLFLTIGVGLSEEIYFRGIIYNLWKTQGKGKAVMVSSILFGICHLMNVLGGAGIIETVLQIFFAFFYGIIFALIFIKTESLLPCVGLHFLHDFCAFVGSELTDVAELGLILAQTVIMLIYIVLLVRHQTKSTINNCAQ